MEEMSFLNVETTIGKKDTYLYWRKSIFLSIFISWSTFHFSRKCFSSIIPCLKSDLSFTVVQIGFLSTTFYAAYSLSKIFGGYLSDHSNTRYFISCGLIISGITNIVFGMFDSIIIMMGCLIISSFFQACAWPACAKLLTFWCGKNERGKWWGLCGMGQNLGAGLIPIFSGFVIAISNWRWAMYLSGFFSVLIGMLMLVTVRDVPASLGLSLPKKNCDQKNQIDDSFIMVMKKYILTNKPLIVFSISGLFLYIVRSAVNDWIPLYLMEAKSYESLMMANSTIWWFEAGGLFGGLLACWASDKLFDSKRLSTNIMLAFFLFFGIIFFYKIPRGHLMLDNIAMLIIGFLVFGIQSIFGLATAEMIIKKYAGTANSFGGFACNIGGAISGLPLAIVVKNYGWVGFFYCISFCCLLTLAFIVFAQVLATKNSSQSDENLS